MIRIGNVKKVQVKENLNDAAEYNDEPVTICHRLEGAGNGEINI